MNLVKNICMSIVSETMVDAVIKNVQAEMQQADSRDSVHRVYRQARTWVRFHCHYAESCTEERSREINLLLKNMRWARLEELKL